MDGYTYLNDNLYLVVSMILDLMANVGTFNTYLNVSVLWFPFFLMLRHYRKKGGLPRLILVFYLLAKILDGFFFDVIAFDVFNPDGGFMPNAKLHWLFRLVGVECRLASFYLLVIFPELHT